jgi:CDP-alcohol phosphatidyltransferase
MIDRASPLGSASHAAAVSGIVARYAAEAAVPVILRATRDEVVGAELRVGGLRIVDRAIKQLARVRDARIVIATDGSIRLPKRLPRGFEVRHIDGEPGAAVEALVGELKAPLVIGADTVWLQINRPDRSMRVVDGASRRAAEDAIYNDLLRGDLGLVARWINKRISFRITRYLLVHLPITPNMVTLLAGVVGLYGALLISTGTYDNVLLGFLLAQVQSILDGCDGELARVRLQQSALGEWLDTIVDDLLNLALVLALGLAIWRRGAPVGTKAINVLAGGTIWDMKIALAIAGMLLFYNIIAYRELIKQGEGGEVLKVRWWFNHGQSLKSMSGAGSHSLKAVMYLGKRDFFVFVWLVLAYFDLLPVILLYMLVLAIVYGGVALGQLLTPEWRLRPPA